MSSGKFENFLSLMKENWSEAHENLLPAFPRIDRISALHNMERAKIMSVYGLQPSDFGLLTALRRSGSPYQLSPTQLRDYMLVSSGGLTKALYRLEEKGMISRSAKEGDGRVKLVALTEKGKASIEEAVNKVQRVHAVLSNEFTEQELAQLDQLLARFLSVIEQDNEISN
ncbi:MarR family winged helix-turn-helix transcriptional regulator [Reinekea marinisedimentorum]|uniref:DNA-binding MarR family transcriptional regulator n=1 Tax=Reinekea marinisedimentorum TaxID=230495 RepID=A0A4R3IDF8_9GAMM|nr:MarR family transcriptional regulator [Reinekea marinisedimentorum]TCS42705.1 DNA-binding MarR family transcriptional regulator [Reinekea marinisedimentorum]